ncbi:chloride channel [Branchiostoma belcheri]|nr:chloride channel [Branchiostoma belcheri]
MAATPWVLLLFALALRSEAVFTSPYQIKLQNNEYSDVLVAIHRDIPEDSQIVDRLKNTPLSVKVVATVDLWRVLGIVGLVHEGDPSHRGVSGKATCTRPADPDLRPGSPGRVSVQSLSTAESLCFRTSEILTEASEDLYIATNSRAFLKEVKILIPKTWSKKPEYQPAGTETFERANVRVDVPNALYGDNPYVQQKGGCGEAGDHMHLTPKYVLDKQYGEAYWGPNGKTFVHEWAHLRWGLFDEYGLDDPAGQSYPHFYSGSLGGVQPTRCSAWVAGTNKHMVTGAPCQLDPVTGVYGPECRFYPDEQTNRATGSYMFMHFLSQVTSFCHSDPRGDPLSYHNREAPNKHNSLRVFDDPSGDPLSYHNREAPNKHNSLRVFECVFFYTAVTSFCHSDPSGDHLSYHNREAPNKHNSLCTSVQVTSFCHSDPTGDPLSYHNREAPNKHNSLCGGRSAWDVMDRHPDFANGANPPREVQSTVPTFVLLQENDYRVVLVLDASNSMRGEPLRRLGQVATRFIRSTVGFGASVGLVKFARHASIDHPVISVDSEADRDALVATIPTTTVFATCIGCGLLKGVEALEAVGPPEGGVILLVTDGRENRDPRIRDVIPELLRKRVIVATVAYSQNADATLESLAQQTGGPSFYAAKRDSSALDNAFTATFEATAGGKGVKKQEEREETDKTPGSWLGFEHTTKPEHQFTYQRSNDSAKRSRPIGRVNSSSNHPNSSSLGRHSLREPPGNHCKKQEEGVETDKTGVRTLDLPDTSPHADALTIRLKLLNEEKSIVGGQTYTNHVHVDSSVGANTTFSFYWLGGSRPTVAIETPLGHVITEGSPMYDVTSDTITVEIPGTAPENGRTNISNPGPDDHDVITIITSYPPTDGEPIRVKAQRSTTCLLVPPPSVSRPNANVVPPEAVSAVSLNYSSSQPTALRIFASVRRGYLPVTGAVVKVHIAKPPDGRVEELVLLDNGAGADVTKNDGIYSRYFLGFSADGRYGVSVTVDNSQGDAAGYTVIQRRAGSGALPMDPDASGSSVQQEPLQQFQRMTTGGVFEVQGVPSGGVPTLDVLPPSRVTDLAVVDVSHADATVTLRWTAAGDDFDQEGPAHYVELRYGRHFDQLADDFLGSPLVDQSQVLQGNLTSPPPPGHVQTVNIRVPERGHNVTFAFSLRMCDNQDNCSPPSNIVTSNLEQIAQPIKANNTVTWVIVGCVVGVAVLAAILILLYFTVCRAKKQIKPADSIHPAPTNGNTSYARTV